jgi:hypothetical protein
MYILEDNSGYYLREDGIGRFLLEDESAYYANATPSYTDPAGVVSVNNPHTLGSYTFTLSAVTADSTRIAFTLDATFGFDATGGSDPRCVQNVMIWVNGELATQDLSQPGFDGHTVTRTFSAFASSHVVSLHRDLLSAEGPNGVLTLGVYDSQPDPLFAQGIVFLSRTFAMPAVTKATTTFGVARAVPLRAGKVVRSIFNLDVGTVRSQNLSATLRSAGINTLHRAVFNNPRATGPATYAAWVAEFEAGIGADLDWAAANGWLVYGQGDDLLRDQDAKNWMAASPFAQAAVVYASTRCRDCGVVVAVDGQDEVDATLPGPASQYRTVIGWWRSVGGAVRLGWPVQATNVNYNWETADLSDYDTRYQTVWEWRAGLPDGRMSGWEYVVALRQAVARNDTVLSRAAPSSCNPTAPGPSTPSSPPAATTRSAPTGSRPSASGRATSSPASGWTWRPGRAPSACTPTTRAAPTGRRGGRRHPRAPPNCRRVRRPATPAGRPSRPRSTRSPAARRSCRRRRRPPRSGGSSSWAAGRACSGPSTSPRWPPPSTGPACS